MPCRVSEGKGRFEGDTELRLSLQETLKPMQSAQLSFSQGTLPQSGTRETKVFSSCPPWQGPWPELPGLLPFCLPQSPCLYFPTWLSWPFSRKLFPGSWGVPGQEGRKAQGLPAVPAQTLLAVRAVLDLGILSGLWERERVMREVGEALTQTRDPCSASDPQASVPAHTKAGACHMKSSA